MTYGLIVIGGGPGGCRAAEMASNAGLPTLLIEKDKVGGVCLNEGCIPTKAMLYSAKLFNGVKYGDKYGVTADNAALDHRRVMVRKDKVVKTLGLGLQSTLKKSGVETIKTTAMRVVPDGNAFTVETPDGVYRAERVLIATGSKPVIPKIDGLADALANGFAITSREALELDEVPRRLAVIGGGVIGLELAAYFNAAGSQVEIIELLPQIGGGFDADIAALLARNLEKKGIVFNLQSRLTSVGNGYVEYERGDTAIKLETDRVLVCIGRRASCDVQLPDIETMSSGIVVDGFCMTNVAGLYAIGDVTGLSMLAHTAARQAEIAVGHMLGGAETMDYAAIPSVIYTSPEAARVGETTESAGAKGLDVDIKTLSMRLSGRYMAENEGGDGVCRIIIGRDGRLLGVQMLADGASEAISAAAVIIGCRLSAEQVMKAVLPHPTVGEMLREH